MDEAEQAWEGAAQETRIFLGGGGRKPPVTSSPALNSPMAPGTKCTQVVSSFVLNLIIFTIQEYPLSILVYSVSCVCQGLWEMVYCGVRMQEMQCSRCWSAERPQMKSSGLSRIPGLEQQPQQNNRHTATQQHPLPQGPGRGGGWAWRGTSPAECPCPLVR